MIGDTSYGRIKGYVTNLPPGKYEVTYSFDVSVSSRGNGKAAAVVIDGAGKRVAPKEGDPACGLLI